MSDEIDSLVLDQIFFCLEDQSRAYFFDIEKLEIVDEETVSVELESLEEIHADSAIDFSVEDGSSNILELPEWTQVDGYRLMEAFVLAVKNPQARAELARGLRENKRVFRNFKDGLKKFPVVEAQWLAFRKENMKRYVCEWLQIQRELRGLTKLTTDKEERADLLSSDFSIREDTHASTGNTRVFVLYSPDNVECAQLHMNIEPSTTANTLSARIVNIEVAEAFRGLGLAGQLLEYCTRLCACENIDSLRIDNSNPVLNKLLERSGFSETARTYVRNFSKESSAPQQ